MINTAKIIFGLFVTFLVIVRVGPSYGFMTYLQIDYALLLAILPSIISDVCYYISHRWFFHGKAHTNKILKAVQNIHIKGHHSHSQWHHSQENWNFWLVYMPISILPTSICLYLIGYTSTILLIGIGNAIISCYIDHQLAHYLCHNKLEGRLGRIGDIFYAIHSYHHRYPNKLQFCALLPWTDAAFGSDIPEHFQTTIQDAYVNRPHRSSYILN